MPARGKKRWGKRLTPLLALALLALLSVINMDLLSQPLGEFFRGEVSFEEFADELQKGYVSDDFIDKNGFVNLNGLFARATGRRTLNNVVRLNNGMLGTTFGELDVTLQADKIADFSGYLRRRDTPFLYVQMPYKESLDGQSYPVGVTSYANRAADELLSRLSAEGTAALDLRPLTSQTPEMLERYFYKTDFHWNSDGAFVAFQEVLSRLHEMFPDGNIDLTYAQAGQWERHSVGDWFLGSSGRRVGVYFGGTDPLIWHTPGFETEMSCAIPVKGLFYRGDFAEANIRAKYIEEKYFFTDTAYVVYIGDNYPLVQHRNPHAPSPLKVMIVKDSFTLPLQAFLSTVFQEIDVVDPRYFEDCSVAEYVEWTEPDLVILALNPGALQEEVFFEFGEEEAAAYLAGEARRETVFQRDIELRASDSDYNYEKFRLESNTTYRVSFEGAEVLKGEPEGVGLRFYDATEETGQRNIIFDLACCGGADDFNWTFRTPDSENEFELLFYAGVCGNTAGNSLIYRNVKLEKMPVGEE